MKSDISKRISNLVAMNATEMNIREIGDEWLTICGEMFLDDAGYAYDKSGNTVFDPSKINKTVTTLDLCTMLLVADELNRFEETYGTPDENSYRESIIKHLRLRADKGDVQAGVVLFFRVRCKVISEGNNPRDQFKV